MRGARHGRVRGSIPNKKSGEFKKAALKPIESRQWYSRHLMWYYASEIVEEQGGGVLQSINEKDAEGRFKLTDSMYEACLKKIQAFIGQHKGREAKKYIKGAGVGCRDDRAGGGKYGSEREQYNGEGGGRVFMWYRRGVFNNYLKKMGVTEQSCTERQCMIALRATSDELRKYSIVCEHLRRFAGPQCFAHLNRFSAEYRVLANEEM